MTLTPLQLPSVHHNPSCDGCARDDEDNRMRKRSLVDTMTVKPHAWNHVL